MSSSLEDDVHELRVDPKQLLGGQVTLTQGEFNARVKQQEAAEVGEVPRTWWLSFSDHAGSRGVIVVTARGLLDALTQANVLGINPGGEVLGIPILADMGHGLKSVPRNTLLTRAELLVLGVI